MVELTKSIRYRINISRGMKGGVSYEATIDAENMDMEGVFALSDKMVSELDKRYPIMEVIIK